MGGGGGLLKCPFSDIRANRKHNINAAGQETNLFERTLWHSEHMQGTHGWTGLICLAPWKCQSITSVSQVLIGVRGDVHPGPRLNWASCISNDMTLFSLPPLISTRAWGNVQRISHACTEPLLPHSQHGAPWQWLSPTPQPHPASNINNHIKAVWQAGR